MTESYGECSDEEFLKRYPPVIRREGAVEAFTSELAGLFPEFDRRDNGTREELAEMVNHLYATNGGAVMYFISSFKLLCKDANELRQLFAMVDQVCARWGRSGCEMISARLYDNLDFGKFKKAVSVFVNTPQKNFQLALESFWWLMGVGKDGDIMQKPEYFAKFHVLLERDDMEACKKLVAEIRNGAIAAIGGAE